MSPEDFIKSLNISKPINGADLKKKNYAFSLTHIDLAPTAGFPTVHFVCEEEDVIIRMALTPVLGMEKSTVNGLSYIFTLMSPEPIKSSLVALITSGLLDTFACAHISPQNDMPEGDGEDQRHIFRLAIEREPEYMEGVYVHTVIATTEVDDKAYSRAVAIVNKQHQAINQEMK